jgi:hypothetical protein
VLLAQPTHTRSSTVTHSHLNITMPPIYQQPVHGRRGLALAPGPGGPGSPAARSPRAHPPSYRRPSCCRPTPLRRTRKRRSSAHTHTQVRARARLRACGVACTTVSYLTEERSDGSWHVPVATLQCERTARGTLRGPSRPAGARGGAPPPNTSERSPRRRSPRFAARSRLAGIRPKLFPANSTRALASGGMVGMMAACLCRS